MGFFARLVFLLAVMAIPGGSGARGSWGLFPSALSLRFFFTYPKLHFLTASIKPGL